MTRKYTSKSVFDDGELRVSSVFLEQFVVTSLSHKDFLPPDCSNSHLLATNLAAHSNLMGTRASYSWRRPLVIVVWSAPWCDTHTYNHHMSMVCTTKKWSVIIIISIVSSIISSSSSVIMIKSSRRETSHLSSCWRRCNCCNCCSFVKLHRR